MKLLTLSAILLFYGQNIMFGQTAKYALIVGIDQYSPPPDYHSSVDNDRLHINNLGGCKNDALSIKAVIESKFQFSPNDIDTLFDRNASRENILKGMNNLLAKCRKGDVAFIYYAGHGSQVYNSLSNEGDRLDESMVPADTWKEGVSDIRDKELAKKFNEFLDKGVNLTVIFDCCHSGSMSRGPDPMRGRVRFVAAKDGAEYDAQDPSRPIPPVTRTDGNFLMLSAAQDNEVAEELDDDNTPSQIHGAFTSALLQALNQQPVDAPVLNLFVSTRAIIKSNGKKQEPVLTANAERQQQTLFGIPNGILPDRYLVAIAGFDKGKVILQGGSAIGLNKRNELMRINSGDTIKLIIDSVTGINKSLASVQKGQIKEIHAGQLFEVSNWASSDAPLLKLYIPDWGISYDQIVNLAQLDKQLQNSKKITWTNDLEKYDPYASVYFEANKCYIKLDTLAKKEIKNYNASSILDLCKKDSTLYFELPVVKGLSSLVSLKLPQSKSIKIVNDASQANYLVCGTIDRNGKPAYGLRKIQVSAEDSLESMPVQTKYFTLKDNSKDALDFVSDSLAEFAMKLSKIRGWLHLAGPKVSIEKAFPYHLEIFNVDSGKAITTATYKVGDSIKLRLVANKEFNRYIGGLRYVYIFGIDKWGGMYLLFPSTTDDQNKFPSKDGEEIGRGFPITSYRVPEPSGTDNFFLLATDEEIPNCDMIFNQVGVRSPTPDSGFGQLIGLGNYGSRRFPPPPIPSSWNLYKLSFKCTH